MRSLKRAALAVAAFALPVSAVLAQDDAFARDMPIAQRSILGVHLNRDSAASVKAKLGKVESWSSGTGHDSFVNWCYRAGSGASGATLHLLSDASDMGNAGRELNVIRLLRGASERMGGVRCGRLRARTRLETDGGLRIGLNHKHAKELLGPPLRESDDSLVYVYDTTEPLPPTSPGYAAFNTPEKREQCFEGKDPYVWISAEIDVVFAEDRAVEIRIARYDSAIC